MENLTFASFNRNQRVRVIVHDFRYVLLAKQEKFAHFFDINNYASNAEFPTASLIPFPV